MIMKTGKCWDLMHYVCSCLGGDPYSIPRVWTRTSIRQEKYRYVLHNVVVTVTNSNGYPAKVELHRRLARKEKGLSSVGTVQ